MDFSILPPIPHTPRWPFLLQEPTRNHLLDLRGYPAGQIEERRTHWLPDTGPYMTINIPEPPHLLKRRGKPGDSSIRDPSLCWSVCARRRQFSRSDGSKGRGLGRLPVCHNSQSLSGHVDRVHRLFPSSCHLSSRSPKLLWSRWFATPSHARSLPSSADWPSAQTHIRRFPPSSA